MPFLPKQFIEILKRLNLINSNRYLRKYLMIDEINHPQIIIKLKQLEKLTNIKAMQNNLWSYVQKEIVSLSIYSQMSLEEQKKRTKTIKIQWWKILSISYI